MSQDDRIAAIEAENRQLRHALDGAVAQNALLLERVQELEARLAKESHTSGKPPSSDGLGRMTRRTKSLRKRSGRKPGGQLGHRGQTLRLVAAPDAVVEQRPTACMGCHARLPDDAAVVLRERRQPPGAGIAPLRLVVREEQALHVRWPAGATVRVGTFSRAAPSRAQYGPRRRALVV
jgi:transposase